MDTKQSPTNLGSLSLFFFFFFFGGGGGGCQLSVVFPTHFNLTNSLSKLLQISLLFRCKPLISALNTGKNNGFPFLDILGYLKNTHKNPKFGKVRQIPIREFSTKFPNWDLSHSSKFGIFVGIL